MQKREEAQGVGVGGDPARAHQTLRFLVKFARAGEVPRPSPDALTAALFAPGCVLRWVALATLEQRASQRARLPAAGRCAPGGVAASGHCCFWAVSSLRHTASGGHASPAFARRVVLAASLPAPAVA